MLRPFALACALALLAASLSAHNDEALQALYQEKLKSEFRNEDKAKKIVEVAILIARDVANDLHQDDEKHENLTTRIDRLENVLGIGRDEGNRLEQLEDEKLRIDTLEAAVGIGRGGNRLVALETAKGQFESDIGDLKTEIDEKVSFGQIGVGAAVFAALIAAGGIARKLSHPSRRK